MVKCVGFVASGPSMHGNDHIDISVNWGFSDRSSTNTTGQAVATVSLDASATQINAALVAAVITSVAASVATGNYTLDTQELVLVNPLAF